MHSSKPIMRGFRIESIKEAKKKYIKILEEGCSKFIDSIIFIMLSRDFNHDSKLLKKLDKNQRVRFRSL